MGRRYDHSHQELHDMAMAAAANMVAENGIRALTARKLAAEIGYSVGTLYNIYANQDELIVTLNGQTLDKLYTALEAVPAADTVPDTLQAVANCYIDFTQTHFNLWNALFEHRLPTGKSLPDWYFDKINRLLALVEGHLTPLFPDAGSPEKAKAARVLWASLHGICSLSSADKLDIVATESARALTASLIRNYLAGLGHGDR